MVFVEEFDIMESFLLFLFLKYLESLLLLGASSFTLSRRDFFFSYYHLEIIVVNSVLNVPEFSRPF